jgi:hypothetical protein
MTNALKTTKPHTDYVLTDKQSKFVDNMLASNCSRTQSAIDAGYSPKSAHVEASRLCRNSNVLAALYDRTISSLSVDAVRALATVSSLSQDAKSEYVKLEASKDIMDRAGLRVVEEETSKLGNDITVKIDLSGN